MLAPLAVAGIGLIGLSGGMAPGSEALFGIVIFLFAFLIRSAPNIFARPQVFGTYWAYVFPVAAVAVLSIKIAESCQTALSEAVASICSILATIAFLVVLTRMSAHMFQVCRGKDTWSDPIVLAMEKAKAAAAAAEKQDTESGGSQVGQSSQAEVGKRQAQPKEGESPASGEFLNASQLLQRLQNLEAIVSQLQPQRSQSETNAEGYFSKRDLLARDDADSTGLSFHHV